MKLWMLAAILLCGTTVLLTSCSKNDSSSDDMPSNVEAEYGLILYGNAGGQMDNIIEKGFYDKVAPLLTDPSKVRIGVCYKYGKDNERITIEHHNYHPEICRKVESWSSTQTRQHLLHWRNYR